MSVISRAFVSCIVSGCNHACEVVFVSTFKGGGKAGGGLCGIFPQVCTRVCGQQKGKGVTRNFFFWSDLSCVRMEAFVPPSANARSLAVRSLAKIETVPVRVHVASSQTGVELRSGLSLESVTVSGLGGCDGRGVRVLVFCEGSYS